MPTWNAPSGTLLSGNKFCMAAIMMPLHTELKKLPQTRIWVKFLEGTCFSNIWGHRFLDIFPVVRQSSLCDNFVPSLALFYTPMHMY